MRGGEERGWVGALLREEAGQSLDEDRRLLSRNCLAKKKSVEEEDVAVRVFGICKKGRRRGRRLREMARSLYQ